MMDHPIIEQIERTGYPKYSDRRECYGSDGLGNEVYSGDEILVIGDEFYLAEELSLDAKEILERMGAGYEIAQ